MPDDPWAAEERLWLEGAEAYGALVHPEAVMVFPGIGVLAGPQIVESLEGAPRWRSVEMTERRLVRPAEGVVLLAYRALARRDGEAPYEAWCGSAWSDGRLVSHQHTPA